MWDKIIDLNHCYLQGEPSDRIRNFCKEEGIRKKLEFFNPRNRTGALRTLMIRNTLAGDLMVLVQFYEASKNQIERYLSAIANQFPEITSLLYVINQKGNDTLYDQEIIVFQGKDHIEETMESLRFKVDAKSFYQTNSAQALRLYEVARDFADLRGDELVYDLYTGTGTIAQFIAQKAKYVVGVEAIPEAIEKAKENAVINKINNVTFEVGDMKNVFNDEFVERHGKADIVITDPPRDGMHGEVVAQLLKLAPKKIVYVSCNSATQARDLKLLSEQYRVVRSRAVDLFPQTHHIENVVLLIKNIE
jgi:23S rRNA (uracil1939-C5)-methyltransferase